MELKKQSQFLYDKLKESIFKNKEDDRYTINKKQIDKRKKETQDKKKQVIYELKDKLFNEEREQQKKDKDNERRQIYEEKERVCC